MKINKLLIVAILLFSAQVFAGVLKHQFWNESTDGSWIQVKVYYKGLEDRPQTTNIGPGTSKDMFNKREVARFTAQLLNPDGSGRVKDGSQAILFDKPSGDKAGLYHLKTDPVCNDQEERCVKKETVCVKYYDNPNIKLTYSRS